MKTFFTVQAFVLLLGIAALVGEIRCVYKFVKCDFEPSYKAEIVYGVGAVTGLGAIIGYMEFGK